MSEIGAAMETDSLQAARQRIAAAYDPKLFHRLALDLSDRLAEHLQTVEQGTGPVLNWREPAENLSAAASSLRAAPRSDLDAGFRDLVELALARGQNLHHPRYVGHQVPASVPISGLFDALAAVTNQVMAIYEMGPWATAVERSLIETWGSRIGLPRGFSGLITHGGSLANLTALLTARNVSLEKSWELGLVDRSAAPVLLAQSDTHYSVARSAGVLGLGTSRIIKIPLDSRRRMDPQRLEEIVSGLRRGGTPIMAVVACACATPTGAFDPLADIADVCRRHQVWLHVDAAHGAATAFSQKHRPLIAGLEQAESFIGDAHKTLFVPALCAFVFYRNGAHRFETFRQEAPYLFDPAAPDLAEIDSGIVTLECTKRAAAYGLWGLWSLFGPQLFGDLIDITFATTRRLYELLVESPDFVALHEPECNIQVFRWHPPSSEPLTPSKLGALNSEIRRRIVHSGEFYLVQTTIDGQPALRVCLMNPLTDEGHLRDLLGAIRRTGKQIYDNQSPSHHG
jgi:L-2,4-diaminobutyrate decarboxylase